MFEKPIHILRYGTNAEQKYIEEMKKLVQYIHINANMLAYSPASISEFLMVNCIQGDRFFFIDPMTHAFQHSIDKIQSYSKKEGKFTIKKSISKLLDAYGEPVLSSIGNDKVITPDIFSDFDILSSFCKNVINFQLNTITEYVNKKGLLEYLDNDDPLLKNIQPSFLIAPYFYLEPNTFEEWLDVNIKMINVCQTFTTNDNMPLFAELVINKSIIEDMDMQNLIIEKYHNSKIKYILLWIDDFDEHTVSSYSLFMYSRLIKELFKVGIKTFNLYGGFFSTLISSFKEELGFSLYGVGHGLEYGESRAVVPVGGGIPTSKYYYYPLHERLDYRLATQLLIAMGYIPKDKSPQLYYENVCNCSICQNTIKDNIDNFNKFENTEYYTVKLKGSEQKRPYASQETKRLCVIHFQYSKHKEFAEFHKKNLKDTLIELEDIYNTYNSLRLLSSDQIFYLNNWCKVLEQLGEIHGEH